jgi:ATP-dependent Clp protease, protease subunit
MMKFNFKRLEVANKASLPAYEIKAAAAGNEATVYVYDAIGEMFGISAKQFVKDITALTADKITLRINSPGGDVFAARAMASALREHPAKVTAVVDGLAASAATTVAMAADEVIMTEGSFFMIHNAWTLAMGDAREMTKVANMLEKINEQIANDYTKRTGKEYNDVRAMMDEETWLTAEEAKAAGFADSIQAGQRASAMWDLSTYEKAPKIENKEVDDFDVEHLQRRLQMLERIA